MVAERARGTLAARAASATCPTTCAPATCWSSTRRRPSPRRCRRALGGGARRRAALRHAGAGPRGRRLVDRRAAQPGRGERRSAAARPASGSTLPGGATAELVAPVRGRRAAVARPRPRRRARAGATSRRHGQPIRYGYVPREWPLDAYQTAFATEPGSAEMPSAGRPFTPELITRLVAARRARSRRSPSTPASPRSSAASRPTPSAIASPTPPRGSSTPCAGGAGA